MEGAGEVDEQRFDGRARHFGSERRGKVGARARFCFRPGLILVYHATKLHYEIAKRGIHQTDTQPADKPGVRLKIDNTTSELSVFETRHRRGGPCSRYDEWI